MSFINNKETLFNTLKFFVFIVLIYLFLNYALGLVLPFILGYVLCLILYPLFKLLSNKYKIPKVISSILCISLFIFLIILFCTSIVLQTFEEGKQFFTKELPFLIENIKLSIEQINNKIENIIKIFPNNIENIEQINNKIENIIKIFPNNIENIILDYIQNSSHVISDIFSNGLKNTSIKVIKKVPNAFMITIISIISCHLMLIDKNNIENIMLKSIPKKYSQKINIVKSSIIEAVSGYIRAQLIIMCLISSICFIGLVILKAPYTLFVAVIIGIIDALPVFGSGFILWPWALYNLINANYGMSIGLIVIYVVILLTRQFIEPKILGKQIGIHPLATLMSIYIGIQIFGILGFIIGPVVMVIIKALQNEKILQKWR